MKKEIENLKNNKNGITLIALIITVILLLILAGITINIATKEDGIIAMANQAKEEQLKANVIEKVSIMLSEYLADRYTNNKKLIEFLNEKKEAGIVQSVTDNNNGTYTIEIDGYNITIKESDLSIIEISKSGPSPKISNIFITLEDGTTEPENYSVELGTKLIIHFDALLEGGKIENIEPNIPYLTTGTEMEKEFIITGIVNGNIYNKTIKISLKDKYKLTNPEIVLSNSNWTRDNVQVSVNWFNNSEDFKKEISLDGGATYQKYVGPIEISKNCIIKAKISNDTDEAISELVIDKIDKLEPNNFVPTVSDLISSTELQINASTQDQEATEEYGQSGIEGYIYYVYKEGSLIVKSDLINNTSWTASGLTVGDAYDIYVEAYDNAGNVTKSDEISYTKLEVYKWTQYNAISTTTYSVKSSSISWERSWKSSNNHFYELLSTATPTSLLDKSTGYFVANAGSFGELDHSVKSGKRYVNETGSNHKKIFAISSNTKTTKKEDSYDVYQIKGTMYEIVNNIIYSKGKIHYGEVTSTDEGKYPENGQQGNYWYEKIE